MCRSLEKSRDAYYKRYSRSHRCWMKRGVVLKLVGSVREREPRVGTRKLYHRIRPKLEQIGAKVGRDKLFGILREERLLVVPKRRFQKTTYSRHRYAVAANRVKQLQITAPNQVWVSDITYLRTGSGFAYLFLVTDAYSRRILGWHLSRDLSHYSALLALERAIRRTGAPEGVFHHSDRGSQYCCHEYLAFLAQHGIVPSMTDESHCYQNAIAERLNGILKDEFNLDQDLNNFQHALATVRDAVSTYNSIRIHWSLGLRTPEEVYKQAA